MTVATRISIRPVLGADDAFRRRLFVGSHPEFAALPPQVREQVLDLQWRAQARQYEADHPHARCQIVELDGAAVGQLVIDESSATIRLVDIVVAAEHRGRGIARGVLTELIVDAGGRCVELCVWSANTIARRLYERLGFEYLSEDGTGYLPMRRVPKEVANDE